MYMLPDSKMLPKLTKTLKNTSNAFASILTVRARRLKKKGHELLAQASKLEALANGKGLDETESAPRSGRA